MIEIQWSISEDLTKVPGYFCRGNVVLKYEGQLLCGSEANDIVLPFRGAYLLANGVSELSEGEYWFFQPHERFSFLVKRKDSKVLLSFRNEVSLSTEYAQFKLSVVEAMRQFYNTHSEHLLISKFDCDRDLASEYQELLSTYSSNSSCSRI